MSHLLCSAGDPKSMQQYAAGRLWDLPGGCPDERMMTHPIWSTWARYKKGINQSVVLDFAKAIAGRRFNRSQLEIDEGWMSCFGEAEFDNTTFPDPRGMVKQLAGLGFRVHLWTPPFIDQGCPSAWEFGVPPKSYFVKEPKMKDGMYLPAWTLWWENFAAGMVDFTNQEAADWWTGRLEKLRYQCCYDAHV